MTRRRPASRGAGRTFSRSVILGLVVAAAGCTLPRWPVEGELISPYGLRWRGILPDRHHGVDIRIPSGTAIRPMAPGRVLFAGTMRGFGRVVWIDHGGEVVTVYAHLSEIRVSEGAAVGAREVIGLSGSSGNAAGPHLHFEIHRWGRARDPVALLGGPPG